MIRPGIILDGKYEILTRIGAGGMGEIFKARHLHLDAFRCIKVMKETLLADDGYRTRFLREARLATQIHHHNIAVVHDFFVGEGGNYMVTEFIDGTTVRQWGAAHGPFPLPIAADVATQVLGGLDHIHRRGLLHRDISPDNVMLSFDADHRLIAKIIDLGIAKDVSSTATDTTMAGVLIGNPKYMSPEQLGLLNDGEQLDGRTDLYSLGVVLYEMLLGVPPFASETPHGYIMKHLTQPPAKFGITRPGMPIADEIESVVFRALEKDRNKRFRDARDFAAALAPFLTAPAGTLTPEDVSHLRRGPEKTVAQEMPLLAPDDATVAESASAESSSAGSSAMEAKAHAFELSLLDEVRTRESAHDREALQRLGEAHPKGSLVGDAARESLARVTQALREREEEEAFQRAWEDGRAAIWRAFLDEHPRSPHTERAQQFLDEALAYESAMASESETALRQFLLKWPAARHHLEAEIRLSMVRERILAKINEPRDFDAAWENGTTAAWDEFLRTHPESQRLDEARQCRQEAADFELAVATNSPAMWRAFLKTWRTGRHRLDAEVRLRTP